VVNPSYTLHYDANGGTGAPADQTGVTLTVSSTTPTRTGYNFVSWNTKSDGSGTNYSRGASITLTSNTTLYAKWSEVAACSLAPSPNNLKASVLSGTAPLGVSFTFGNPTQQTSYVIDFGDGISSATNPNSGLSHTYYNATGADATYTAELSCLPGGASQQVDILVHSSVNLAPTIAYTSTSIANGEVITASDSAHLGATITDTLDTVKLVLRWQISGDASTYEYPSSPTHETSPNTQEFDLGSLAAGTTVTYWAVGDDGTTVVQTTPRQFTVVGANSLSCVATPAIVKPTFGVKVNIITGGLVAAPYDLKSTDTLGVDSALPGIATGNDRYVSFSTEGTYTVWARDPQWSALGITEWTNCGTVEVKSSGDPGGGEQS
jgi:uncharacterized repeat protein (TIGR02543 family)